MKYVVFVYFMCVAQVADVSRPETRCNRVCLSLSLARFVCNKFRSIGNLTNRDGRSLRSTIHHTIPNDYFIRTVWIYVLLLGFRIFFRTFYGHCGPVFSRSFLLQIFISLEAYDVVIESTCSLGHLVFGFLS